MTYYLISLLIGILIGVIANFSSNFNKISNILQLFFLALILFIMGYKIGSKKEILNYFGMIGYKAFIISLFSIMGSVFVLYFIRKFVFGLIKNKRGMEK